jgi:hypothetical protein
MHAGVQVTCKRLPMSTKGQDFRPGVQQDFTESLWLCAVPNQKTIPDKVDACDSRLKHNHIILSCLTILSRHNQTQLETVITVTANPFVRLNARQCNQSLSPATFLADMPATGSSATAAGSPPPSPTTTPSSSPAMTPSAKPSPPSPPPAPAALSSRIFRASPPPGTP